MTMSSAHYANFPSLHLHHISFYNPSVASPTSQLISQTFRRFIYVTAHLQTFHHFAYIIDILQPFRRFTYVTAHSTTLPLPHLHHSSFSNPSFASPTSQALHLIHLASRIDIEIYSRAHSPTFLSLHLSHNSFSNPSVALPTSQLILQPFRDVTYVTTHSQPFRRFSYVTGSSLTSPGEPSMKEAERSLNAS